MIALKEYGIVPDILDRMCTEKLEVNFRQGRSMVELGNILTPTDVKNPPILKWSSDPQSLYLICMIDPDAPTPETPTYREWQHWLVGNVHGDDVAEGDVLTAYVGASPAKGTGLHRYILVVYRQPKELGFDEQVITKSEGLIRAKFSISQFSRKNALGEPIAVNFFRAEWDPQVDVNMNGYTDFPVEEKKVEKIPSHMGMEEETHASLLQIPKLYSSIMKSKSSIADLNQMQNQ